MVFGTIMCDEIPLYTLYILFMCIKCEPYHQNVIIDSPPFIDNKNRFLSHSLARCVFQWNLWICNDFAMCPSSAQNVFAGGWFEIDSMMMDKFGQTNASNEVETNFRGAERIRSLFGPDSAQTITFVWLRLIGVNLITTSDSFQFNGGFRLSIGSRY